MTQYTNQDPESIDEKLIAIIKQTWKPYMTSEEFNDTQWEKTFMFLEIKDFLTSELTRARKQDYIDGTRSIKGTFEDIDKRARRDELTMLMKAYDFLPHPDFYKSIEKRLAQLESELSKGERA